MKLPSLRLTWFGGLCLAAGLVLTGYWLEIKDGIAPCPLCTLQRLTFILLSGLFLLGCLLGNRQSWVHKLTGGLASLVAALGIWLAGRQVWLQWLPPNENTDCSVSLSYLFKMLPVNEALRKAMNGSVECSQVVWTTLHLSLAEWSLVFFTILLVLSIFQTARTSRP